MDTQSVRTSAFSAPGFSSPVTSSDQTTPPGESADPGRVSANGSVGVALRSGVVDRRKTADQPSSFAGRPQRDGQNRGSLKNGLDHANPGVPIDTSTRRRRATDASGSSLNQIDRTPVPAEVLRAPGPSAGSSPAPDVGPTPTFTIFGADAVSLPNSNDALQQREQRVDAYADRVKTQIANIEIGSEAERNVKLQNARPFMTPSGYFSGGLLAGGYDPNQEIKATFSSYVGKGHPETRTGSDERAYKAWEIAAGAIEHDRPGPGGMVNFQFMKIDPADQATVRNLEFLGTKLQNHWQQTVAAPMQDPSGTLAARSGKADAHAIQATLQSLQANRDIFAKLSSEGQQAINRTVDQAGQVIIPNVYGYPLAGHAFIPHKPYDGNYENRPNHGLMIGLNQGTVSEIHGDKDFANWAKRHRDDLLQSFNARDRQGGLDAHWPKAGDVLDNLIAGNNVTYPGYKNLVSDQKIPAGELFNYTRSRGSDYQLKYGNLTAGAGDTNSAGIASEYQAVNSKNTAWADQTEVFGSSAQNWKSAKGIWGNTFGYIPAIGTAGNIAFGVHDSLYGMTAKDRIGGNVAATMSGLQLMHELAPAAAGLAAGEARPVLNSSAGYDSAWKYNQKTSEFTFTPPQRVNGKIGYPMSPMNPPRIGEGNRPGSELPGKNGQASVEEHVELNTDNSSSDVEPSGKQAPGEPVTVQADARRTSQATLADLSDANNRTGTSGPDESGSDLENAHASAPLIRPKSRKPFIRPRSGQSPVQFSSTESLSSNGGGSTNPAISNSKMASRRGSGQSGVSGLLDANRLSAEEETGFKKYFPGGLRQAESYLKSRALSLNRSPGYLSSDQYPALRSWSGIPQKEINRLMDRYLSVWEPEPRQADYESVEDFTSARNAYDERIAKYKEGEDFNIHKYWDDLVSDQNNKFRTFVDSQTKRLAIATKVYDDFTANPTRYHAKPDDPYTIRKQLTGSHDGKRDSMYLQREALNFGEQRFYKLDSKEISELRSSFLSLFGRDNSKIEAAFLNRKNELEDELYRYGNAGVSRDTVEARKKALQDRFNGDIETAIKNMDLMYKRIALYGTIGTLSISAISAILWKTIDEIKGKS